MSDVSIKTSEVQGKGIFAERDFKEGEKILEVDDSHAVTNTSTLTQEQLNFDTDFLEGGKMILMQEPEKFINHSCNPTSYVKTINGIRTVLAMRDIDKGEEVTYDYVINGDNDGTFPCHCGSKNCRHVYQGNFFKLSRDLKLKYLPYLDDWFIKEHQVEIDRLKNETN